MAGFKYKQYFFNLLSYHDFVKNTNISNNELANSKSLNKSVNRLKREVNQLIGQFAILTSQEAIRWRADTIYEEGEIVSYITTDNPTKDDIKNSYYLAIPNPVINQSYYPDLNPEFWCKITLDDLYPWLNIENYPSKSDNESDWNIEHDFDVINLKYLRYALEQFKDFLDSYLAGIYIKQDNKINLEVTKPTHVTTKQYVDDRFEVAYQQFLDIQTLLNDYIYVNNLTKQMQTRKTNIDAIRTTNNGFLPGVPSFTDIGSNNEQFRSMYAINFQGTALKAKYADLAEKYETSKQFKPGDILGIDKTGDIDHFNPVKHKMPLGVVSDKPGFILNNDIEGVVIALKGQTIARVKGKVDIGDPLYVCSGDYATNVKTRKSHFIGMSLEKKSNEEIGLVNIKI